MREYEINERLLDGVIKKGVSRAMRARFAYRAAGVLVALIMLSAGGVAAGYYAGIIGWDGRPLSEPVITPVPTDPPIHTEFHAIDEYTNALIDERPDFEFWVAEYADEGGENGGCIGIPTERFKSLDQGVNRIRASGLRVRTSIPAGYRFTSLDVAFYFTEQDVRETVLASQEAKAEGVILKRYIPPESIRNQIERYELAFDGDKGQSIRIDAMLDYPSSEWGFGVRDGMTYEVVHVAGMANALYMTRNDLETSTLYLSRNVEPPKDHVVSPSFDFEHWDDAGFFETQQFGVARYTIESDGLTREEMIALAESLQ